MMEKDFNFEDIGKQTPYRTPEDFFDKMQERIMEQTLKKKDKKPFRLKLVLTTVLSAAALLAGVLFLASPPSDTNELSSNSFIVSTHLSTSYSEAMDQYVEDMSDEELAEWIEFSENDVFMNLN
jgi:hypothetical protein